MTCDEYANEYAAEWVDMQHARQGSATLADRRQWFLEGLTLGAARYVGPRTAARNDAEPTSEQLIEAVAS